MTATAFDAIIRGGQYDGEIVTFNPVPAGTPLKEFIEHKGTKLVFLGSANEEGPIALEDEATGLPVLVEYPR